MAQSAHSARTILWAGIACTYWGFSVHAYQDDFISGTLIESFLRKVKFTQSGVQCFFKHTFNQSLYSEKFLPACFLHCIDFLEYGAQLTEPRGFLESSLEIFHQRIKECLWVNPYALLFLIQRIQPILTPIVKHHKEEQKKGVNKAIRQALLTRFNELKVQPELFLNNLTDEILVIACGSDEQPTVQQLTWSVVRFIEAALNKLIWDPRDDIDTWECVKALALSLEALYEARIIPDTKALNQCYWSLVYRYCYFLETAGSELSRECYAKIKKDSADTPLTFLMLEEQEDFITTKVDRLHKALMEGELKAKAKEQGIITDRILLKNIKAPDNRFISKQAK